MNDSKPTLLTWIAGIAVLLIVGGIAVATMKPTQKAGAFNPTGAGTYLLQSSISKSQTTILLTSFTEPSSNTPYTMNYLGSDIEYGTISPSQSNNEFVSFTGITQNANGTATLTGVVRGLARTPGTGGCVASSTLAHAFPGQTSFILSNSPCFYSEYAVKRNNQTITGQWNFPSTTPLAARFDVDPSAGVWTTMPDTVFTSKGYVDAQVTGGCANATTATRGCVEMATAAEAAASTAIGGTGANLALGANLSTSTPTATCTTFCIVGAVSGKISQLFLDLTQSFIFTSAVSLAASDVTTHALTLNGVAYKFPAGNGASSTVLSSNGAGGLSWLTPTVYALAATSSIMSTSAAASTTMATIAIPANTITTHSALKVSSTFISSDGGNYCTGEVQFGSGTATSSIGLASESIAGSYVFTLDGTIRANALGQATSTFVGTNLGNPGTPSVTTAGFGNSGTQMFLAKGTAYNLAAQTYLAFILYSTGGINCRLAGADVEVVNQ